MSAGVDALRDLRGHELAALAKLPLSVGQIAIHKALDGVPLSKAELPQFRRLTGTRFGKPNPAGYRGLVLGAGRQGGKTRHVDAVIIMRNALRTVPRAPGETLHIPCVGPTREHVAVLVDAVASLAAALKIPHDRLTGEVRFPTLGVHVTVRTADRAAGRSLRSLCAVIDEAAFIGSDAEGAAVNDVEVRAAVTAGLVTTGPGPWVMTSTFWAKRGDFYDTWAKHYGRPGGDVLAVRAPTWILNPTVSESAARSLATDERRFRREFGAEPLDAVDAAFPLDLIRGAVRPGDAGTDPQSGIAYAGGYDHSRLKGDRAVLVIGHREERSTPFGVKQRYVVDRVVTWSAGYDSTRQLQELAGWCSRYRISRLLADRYDLPHVGATLKHHGIVVEQYSPTNADTERDLEFMLSLFETLGVSLPDHKALLKELEHDVVVERLPGGRVRVRARNARGRHDDHVHALIRWLVRAQSLAASGDGTVRMDLGVTRIEGSVQLRPTFFREKRMADGRVVRMPCAPPMTTVLGRQLARERRAQGVIDREVDLDAAGNVIPIDDAGDPPPLNIPILTAR